ncbi:MAG: FHA domain-containing protein [Myxococcota bacterium]|nr:FHA domain-containing protein [Myxococcota bacterium]
MGHELAPGASYCPFGHPVALDPTQFTGGAYPGAGGFGAPPPGGGYVPPTPPPPAPGLQMPPAQPGGFPPVQPGFGAHPGPTHQGRNEPDPHPVPPAALRGFLVAFGSNPSGDFWPLTGGRLTIGRFGSGDHIDIGLQDPTISSRHGVIVVDAASGTITIEDTGSTNGTFVNDEHLGFNGRRDLRDGDRLRFGAYATIVKVIGRV